MKAPPRHSPDQSGTRNFHFDFSPDRECAPNLLVSQCSRILFGTRCFQWLARGQFYHFRGIQRQKLLRSRPVPQALFLPLPPSSPKSAPVYGLLIPLVTERRDPSQRAPKEPPRQMALREEQPIVPGALDQTSAYFHQPLLQAGERPVVDSRRQCQPPPQVAQDVGDHTQLERTLFDRNRL